MCGCGDDWNRPLVGVRSRHFLGALAGAAMTLVNSLFLRRSKAARVGSVSAARIVSVPLTVLKVPATALAMAVVSLSKPSSSQLWPSHMASTPYAAVDIATAQATFRANFRGITFALVILTMVRFR
jgi:hypothetical protein